MTPKTKQNIEHVQDELTTAYNALLKARQHAEAATMEDGDSSAYLRALPKRIEKEIGRIGSFRSTLSSATREV